MTAPILTTQHMQQADEATINAGTPGQELMARAGQAVFDGIIEMFEPTPVLVMCGPGNNGGDGFVIAKLLKDAGWQVTVGLLGEKENLKGDPLHFASQWGGKIHPLTPTLLKGQGLVVDALFGTGLNTPLKDAALDMVQALNKRGTPCVAVDIPSGVDGNTGAILGDAPTCQLTVTMQSLKRGHVLCPGKTKCGTIMVTDIGIKVPTNHPVQENTPHLWQHMFPKAGGNTHKYGRGHVLLKVGDMPGAAILAAQGARRAGAGMVTLGCHPNLTTLLATTLPGCPTTAVTDVAPFRVPAHDQKVSTLLLGSGCAATKALQNDVLDALRTEKACVLDAGALTVFEHQPGHLYSALHRKTVLTPHSGEFARLFDGSKSNKIDNTLQAATTAGCVVLHKGNDTVIAAPDGRAAVTTNAPATLATAGSGDVLGGMIAGLMAQGMPAFEAACAASWLHGEVATYFGPGLIAEDIYTYLPEVLADLHDGTLME